MTAFLNEPLLELRRASVRDELTATLAALDATLPLHVPIRIGEQDGGETGALVSVDPGRPDRVVALAASATAADADAAVAAAERGFARWGATTAAERAQTLTRAAAVLRARRARLAALIVREAGKPWEEADAEICEAIDFVEFYARQAIELEREPELLQLPGERNAMRYVPRGVVAVIAPWNFPVAISTGMVVAGLASGNAVVYKPSELTPACGGAVVDALREAGVPAEALSLLPGGDEPGAALVRHPGVHTIAFTGSCAVGLEIVRAAAEVAPGQRHLKRVVAEMGGKNCIVVDADADLDEVVPAAIRSAFGFAGQKCSAASRLLVHEALYETFAARLAGASEALLVDHAERFGIDLGPVVDAAAQERHRRAAALAAEQGTVLADGAALPGEGFFCSPTVVGELPPDSPLLSEEVFAPLLTVEPVASIAAACDAVDGSSFALTAGLFSRNPATVAEVTRRLPVGNLYVNRATTGAMVARQPFGGNRLSGTGTKAGGPGYLAAFVEPRAVCENTMRHGLVV
jgi:RHH-type transcriptional regulator, proline utilization regulon repressor / proline dehydrogenase / delta 1-pyrroline-5-carboxylate dehydrogenase